MAVAAPNCEPIELTSGTAQSVQAQFSHLNSLIHQAAYEHSEQIFYGSTASDCDGSDDKAPMPERAAVKKAAKKAKKAKGIQ